MLGRDKTYLVAHNFCQLRIAIYVRQQSTCNEDEAARTRKCIDRGVIEQVKFPW